MGYFGGPACGPARQAACRISSIPEGQMRLWNRGRCREREGATEYPVCLAPLVLYLLEKMWLPETDALLEGGAKRIWLNSAPAGHHLAFSHVHLHKSLLRSQPPKQIHSVVTPPNNRFPSATKSISPGNCRRTWQGFLQEKDNLASTRPHLKPGDHSIALPSLVHPEIHHPCLLQCSLQTGLGV